MPSDLHVIEASHTDRQSTFVVHDRGSILDPVWDVDRVDIEDLVLAYMSQGESDGARRNPVSVVR